MYFACQTTDYLFKEFGHHRSRGLLCSKTESQLKVFENHDTGTQVYLLLIYTIRCASLM